MEAGGGVDLGHRIDELAQVRPERVVLSWPMHVEAHPTPPHEVRSWLDRVNKVFGDAGVSWELKGIAACLVGRHYGRVRRTSNRWYVDAGHQRDEALLFIPRIVRFEKFDPCRFCSEDRVCDGVAEGLIGTRLVSDIRPLCFSGS